LTGAWGGAGAGEQDAERDASPNHGYWIQAGDVLQVSVWNEPELQLEVLVRPDGGISMPLAGDIAAQGQTTEVLRQTISERIGRYIPDAEVSVAVRQVLGNKIYVIGKVNRPGDFILAHGIDVMQALSMAGGMTTFAAADKIKILRWRNEDRIAIPFNYDEVAGGENLDQNISLRSGDVVVVP
jgi:polysaccharide export outer membrane protein